MSDEKKKQDQEIEDTAKVPLKKSGRKGRKTESSRKLDKQEEKMQDLGQKLDELNDKYLRLFSEFDNYRKRTQKEKLELFKTASEDVMIAILPVIDDFERAIKSTDENGMDDKYKEGVELIYNKLINTLKQRGLEQMSTLGEEFDTDFHEAITNIPAPEPGMKGKVVDEIERGYKLNDKVIRFAKVVVGN